MKKVFACDLDNTLIYSYKKDIGKSVCVERLEGRDLSFMTEKSSAALQKIDNLFHFIPVTTRSQIQYNRINLPADNLQTAVVANGAILLQNGKPDKDWLFDSEKLFSPYFKEYDACRKLLESDPNITMEIRLVDGFFLFTKSTSPEKTCETLNNKIKNSGLVSMNVSQKVYVMPKKMNKGTAIKRLREIYPGKKVISAGDSNFDIPMLEQSDIALYPESLDIKEKNNACFIWNETGIFSDFLLDKLLSISGL